MSGYPPSPSDQPHSFGPQAPPPDFQSAAPSFEAPQKRRLSALAWAGIGVGALALAATAATAILLLSAMQWGGEAASDQSQRTEQPTAAAAGEESGSAEEPQQQDPDRSSAEVLLLTEPTDFTQPLSWSVPMGSGWSVAGFDQAGVTRLTHAESGCEFAAYQGTDTSLGDTANDLEASNLITQLLLGEVLPLDLTGEPVRDADDPTYTNIPQALGGLDIEFGHSSFTYTDGGDDQRHRTLVARAFTDAGSVLYAEVDCPASSENKQITADVLSQLKVMDLSTG